MAATGRCLCGAVQFSAEQVETHFHACHCGMCRRWSGGPLFAALASGVTFSGEEPATYASSEWAERGFCRRCGTNLFYRFKDGGQCVLCVGAFDDPTPFKLVGEIYVDHQPPGYRFAGELERRTEAEVVAKYMSGGKV